MAPEISIFLWSAGLNDGQKNSTKRLSTKSFPMVKQANERPYAEYCTANQFQAVPLVLRLNESLKVAFVILAEF